MNIVFYLDIADGFQARSCQLQTLYVSFRDLDWQVKYIIIDYIIVLINYARLTNTSHCYNKYIK